MDLLRRVGRETKQRVNLGTSKENSEILVSEVSGNKETSQIRLRAWEQFWIPRGQPSRRIPLKVMDQLLPHLIYPAGP